MNFPSRTASWLVLSCLGAHAAPVGISLDGSMGPRTTLTGPNFIIPASLGTQVGSNLFHSFSEFNLLNGETADFTGTGATGPIHNVIARVTGGDPSSIDGTIQCDIAGANFFLLNPSGVMFGPHAQVDVKGAFTVGTANFVNLADGVGKFNTSLGGGDVLTSADVSAFGFLGAPQAVQFNQTQLALAAGARLAVVGGDIALDAATLTAPGGVFTLVSAKGPGLIDFDSSGPTGAATVTSFGNITLQNGAKIAIDGVQGGGSVVIRGGKIVLQNGSSLSAINSGTNAGGGIQVTADSLTADDSTIQTQTTAGATAAASAGPVSVTVANAVQVLDGGTIASTTSSAGRAGDVSISADSLTIDGSVDQTAAIAPFTGVASDCAPNSSGAGGNLMLNIAGAIAIRSGGSIDSDTAGSGNAGNVDVVHADILSIDGTKAIPYGQFTGISSSTDVGATGNGGVVDLAVTRDVSIAVSGTILASTFSGGAAGEIILGARSLLIDGAVDPNTLTGITSNAEAGSTQAGGRIKVTLTGNLACTGGGGIDSQAFSLGNGGDVVVSARGNVSISDGGYITADTYASGHGGVVSVTASSIVIDGAGPAGVGFLTGISSVSAPNLGSVPTGNGGTVTVTAANSLQLIHGGQISATATLADAGDITIKAGQNIDLTDGSSILTSAGDNGGSIHLTGGQEVFLFDSEIKSEADGGAGTNGGNITIDPVFVALDESQISANDLNGTGGNILIISDNFLNSSTSITATGATDGTITISSPNLDLGGKLASLPNIPVDDGQELRESCARSIAHEFSTLVVTGRGGTESGPEELTPDFGGADFGSPGPTR